MLYIVGTGLNGPKSITIEGLDAIRECPHVYLDTYTSFQSGFSVQDFEKALGKSVLPAKRDFLEGKVPILDLAAEEDVALLVIGDPLMATTHNMVRKMATEKGVETKVLGNSSIVNALPARAGLSIYRMGAPVSIPFLSEKFVPVSPYAKILKNLDTGLHTLLLLDLQDQRTMEPAVVLSSLLEMGRRLGDSRINGETMIIAGSMIGSNRECMCITSMRYLKDMENRPPMSFIVPAELTEDEEAFVKAFCTTYP
ncbi:MAG: diphthine synthase [Candidatus Thermoplasmatota archaeon]|nr:diphthine synthase [Candidatus Thermoplasmatota archaeon]MCL5730561.1 diphthine synthase [Candidatus Thermoplasmatota archaeon]